MKCVGQEEPVNSLFTTLQKLKTQEKTANAKYKQRYQKQEKYKHPIQYVDLKTRIKNVLYACEGAGAQNKNVNSCKE